MKKLILGLLAGLLAVHGATGAEYSAPGDYVELFQPQPVETGDKIEVREFFWYGCPHCYSLEPILQRWLKNKPANAEFVRMPAILRESWAAHARAYYTFEALEITDKLRGPLFRAIHEERRKLGDVESLADFVAQQGVNRKSFIETYNSSAVDSNVRRTQVIGRRYEIDGVPTIIVDGKYRTTSTMAGSHEELMKVVDFLVKKAAAERQKPPS